MWSWFLVSLATASPLCALGTGADFGPAASLLSSASLTEALTVQGELGHYTTSVEKGVIDVRFWVQDSPRSLGLIGIPDGFKAARKAGGWVRDTDPSWGPTGYDVYSRELQLAGADLSLRVWVQDKDQVVAVNATLYKGDLASLPECAPLLRPSWWSGPDALTGREVLADGQATERGVVLEVPVEAGPIELAAWSEGGRWNLEAVFYATKDDRRQPGKFDLDPAAGTSWDFAVPGDLLIFGTPMNRGGAPVPVHAALLRADSGVLVAVPLTEDALVAMAESKSKAIDAEFERKARDRATWEGIQAKKAADEAAEAERYAKALNTPQRHWMATANLVEEGSGRQMFITLCVLFDDSEDADEAELVKSADYASEHGSLWKGARSSFQKTTWTFGWPAAAPEYPGCDTVVHY